MSYLLDHKKYVKTQRAEFEKVALASVRSVLLQTLDAYDQKYAAYAKDADAWTRRDGIQVFLRGMTLKKRQDTVGKSEIFLYSVIADDGRTVEPQTFIMPHYQQMAKDETFLFTNPPMLFDGKPRGSLDYQILSFDTKTENHDSSVNAAVSMTKAVGNVVAAALSAAVGPAAAVIGPLVGTVADTVKKVAIDHKDELVGQFLGTLTGHDHQGVGPYRLAKPEFSVSNGDIEIDILVVRVPSEKRTHTGKNRRDAGQVPQRKAYTGIKLSNEMLRPRTATIHYATPAVTRKV